MSALKFGDLPKTGAVNPFNIRFSQKKISNTFSKKSGGGSIFAAIEGLKNGSISPSAFPAIRIVEKDGLIYTIDNRRLYIYQQAGIPIQYKKLDFDSLSDFDKKKFDTDNQGTSVIVRGM